ncbi:MAG: hypothetical protein RR034_04180, partial [Bacteroidales bacterium]
DESGKVLKIHSRKLLKKLSVLIMMRFFFMYDVLSQNFSCGLKYGVKKECYNIIPYHSILQSKMEWFSYC